MALPQNLINYIHQQGLITDDQYNQVMANPGSQGTKLLANLGAQLQGTQFNASIGASAFQQGMLHLLNQATNTQQGLLFNVAGRGFIGGFNNLTAKAQDLNNQQAMQNLQNKSLQAGMSAEINQANISSQIQQLVQGITS